MSSFMLELSDTEVNYLSRLIGIDIGWQRKRGNDANVAIAESIYLKLKRLKGKKLPENKLGYNPRPPGARKPSKPTPAPPPKKVYRGELK